MFSDDVYLCYFAVDQIHLCMLKYICVLSHDDSILDLNIDEGFTNRVCCELFWNKNRIR